MKPYCLITAAIAGLAAAHRKGHETKGHEPKGHEFKAAGSEDRRSPCPGLNALANHGFLPRSGKDIDLNIVRSAIVDGYNFVPEFYDDAVSQVFTFNLSTTSHPSTTFNLDDLKKHDAIEFDGSLSRNDDFFGDDLTFNFGIWATVAERLGLYESRHSHADKFVSIETAAKARAARVEDAKRVNPTFNASQNQITGSPGTTALYLLTLWDDEAEAAPKDWVRPWFEEERIPYEEGYKKPHKPRDSDLLTKINEAVNAVEV